MEIRERSASFLAPLSGIQRGAIRSSAPTTTSGACHLMGAPSGVGTIARAGGPGGPPDTTTEQLLPAAADVVGAACRAGAAAARARRVRDERRGRGGKRHEQCEQDLPHPLVSQTGPRKWRALTNK